MGYQLSSGPLLAYYPFNYTNYSGDSLNKYNFTNIQGLIHSTTGIISSGVTLTGANPATAPAMYTKNTGDLSMKYNNGFTLAAWVNLRKPTVNQTVIDATLRFPDVSYRL